MKKRATAKRPVAQIARERVVEHAPAGADLEALDRLAAQVAARVTGAPISGARVRNILAHPSDAEAERTTGAFPQAATEARPGDRAERGDTAEDDLTAVLTQQHRDILDLFDEVARSTGDARRNSFRTLIRHLAIHETAEEEVIHPFARRDVPGGEEIVSKLLADEKDLKERLGHLDGMDTDDEEFLQLLLSLRADMQDHMQAEELDEYPAIGNAADPARLEQMAKAIRAAEALAPTPPEGATSVDPSSGPIKAIVDRARKRDEEDMKATGGEE